MAKGIICVENISKWEELWLLFKETLSILFGSTSETVVNLRENILKVDRVGEFTRMDRDLAEKEVEDLQNN